MALHRDPAAFAVGTLFRANAQRVEIKEGKENGGYFHSLSLSSRSPNSLS